MTQKCFSEEAALDVLHKMDHVRLLNHPQRFW